MMMKNDVCGIYLITNKMTGQMYVGQSICIYRRFDEHRRAQGFGHSRIDNAINKYGAENFSFEIIMTIENDTKKLNDAEREWIAILNTYEDKNHYNLTPGGDFSPMKVPEIAAKVSKSRKGMKFSEETIKKMSKAKSGENHPLYGKKGEEHPSYGRKHTPKAKEKMSRAQNTTGFFRVHKHKNSACKQGFAYVYKYYDDDNKRYEISSVDIKKLEKKVKAKGLEWFKLEE